jgi:tripartite-type tricarboxylate transporter receptor subunit TctC
MRFACSKPPAPRKSNPATERLREMLRLVTIQLLAAIAFITLPLTAKAQDYPAQPIRIIVGYPPGAGIDFTARLFADWLKTAFNRPVLVENRPGASGQLAAEYVSHAEPDGYTLVYAVGSDYTWTKFLSDQPTIDPLKDLTPIATAISSVNCIAVNAASPIKTLQDLVEFTKQNLGKLTYGTAGVQSYYYLIGQALKQQGVDMLHVPYKGTPPVVSALLSREIDVGLTTLASVAPHIANGNVRVLAVMEPNRYPGVPDVPAVSEVLPKFHAPLSWFGFFGPPGTPQPIVDKLHNEIGKALGDTEIRAKIKELNLTPFPTQSNEIRPLIIESTDTFAQFIKSMNIKAAD